jgi:hypothetical protein
MNGGRLNEPWDGTNEPEAGSMKGQVTIEELLSLAIYLAILSMLLSASLSFRGSGEEWARSIFLEAQASASARAYDSFSNSNIPYPDFWEGGGRGYIEVPNEYGNGTIAAPLLRGVAEYPEGEPI